MPGYLLVNPRSGDERPTPHELRDAAERRGIAVHVLGDDEDASGLARSAEADALGIAGGDGSLAPIAAIAIERDLPFVCIPYGTRNHFARDLGLDGDDPIGALRAFDAGAERRVDACKLDERVFLNNVSLGLYARLVHRRESHRRRRDVLAQARAVALVLRDRHPVRLALDGRPISAKLVLVANNHYDLKLFSLGERPALDEGLLHVYTARGWLPGSWEERSAERLELDASARLEGALDGEPIVVEPPARFEIAPRALRVLVPEG